MGRCVGVCSLGLEESDPWAWLSALLPGSLARLPCIPPCLGSGLGVLTRPPLPCIGITQEKINEMRAAPEQQMIADIHCMIAAGQDLDWIDAQGATLVSTWARRVGLGAQHQPSWGGPASG